MTLQHCPHCNVSLQGDPIPESHRQWYSGTHWRREIGIEVQGVYDGVLYYECRNCSGTWHRFPEDHWLRKKAESYIHEPKT